MTSLVVLAAGLGSRLGGSCHKSLVPIVGNCGTLDLLLAAAQRQHWLTHIIVVTGHEADSVARRVSIVAPTAAVVHNPDFATAGPVRSLRRAVDEAVVAAHGEGGVWAVNADTVYAPEFWAAMESANRVTHRSVAAVCVHRRVVNDHTRVPVAVAGGAVVGIGPVARESDFDMAPAVWWSAVALPRFRDIVDRGTDRMQWEVISRLVAAGADWQGRVSALEVPADCAFDIDTATDVAQARLRVAQ